MNIEGTNYGRRMASLRRKDGNFAAPDILATGSCNALRDRPNFDVCGDRAALMKKGLKHVFGVGFGKLLRDRAALMKKGLKRRADL